MGCRFRARRQLLETIKAGREGRRGIPLRPLHEANQRVGNRTDLDHRRVTRVAVAGTGTTQHMTEIVQRISQQRVAGLEGLEEALLVAHRGGGLLDTLPDVSLRGCARDMVGGLQPDCGIAHVLDGAH